MGTDPIAVQFMGGASGKEEEDRALFRKIHKIYQDNTSKRVFWIWGIYKKDRLLGHFELKETENTGKEELEIVYLVHPDARRQGLMTEILSYFKTHQSNWGKQIIATVAPHNTHSLMLLEKWGITKREEIEDEEGNYLKIYLDL